MEKNSSSNSKATNDSNTYINIDSYSPTAKHQENSKTYTKDYWNKIRKYNKKSLKQSTKAIKLFHRVWLSAVLLISLSISEFFVLGLTDMFSFRRNNQNLKSSVSIPQQVTHKELANILENAGIIHSAYYFEMYMDLFGKTKNVFPGEYDLFKNLDYKAIVSALGSTAYRTDSINVVFPEGRNVEEYAAILEKNGICSKDAFLNECKSSKYEKKYPFLKLIGNTEKRVYKLEGYLFPDSYTAFKNTDPSFIISDMLDNYEVKVLKNEKYFTMEKDEDFNKNQKKTLSGKFNCDQVITIASLVEAEAADEDDMMVIASILKNRLLKSDDVDFAHLDLDSTSFYPRRNGDDGAEINNDYNTRAINGLPPGPICNPGANAINAVINSKKTYYYYFAHDKNKKPYYASNSADHIRNLRRIEQVNSR